MNIQKPAYSITFVAAMLGIVFLISVSGCTPAIKPEVKQQVTYFGPFAELQKHPRRFVGEVAIFGGKIITTQPGETTTRITVLQLALDHNSRPIDGDHSAGRFRIETRDFLDPAIYKTGTLITMAGRLLRGESDRIGEYPYLYPVFNSLQIRVWRPQKETSPQFHFGFGMGTSF